MKKILILILLLLSTTAYAQTVFPNRGGTGTSTPPTFGQMLRGNSSGYYDLVATSSLGLPTFANTGFWDIVTNFGVPTVSTTTPASVPILNASTSVRIGNNGATFLMDIQDILSTFYVPRITGSSAGGLGQLLGIQAGLLIWESTANGICATTDPCISFVPSALAPIANIFWDYTNNEMEFTGATTYLFDSAIKPGGIIDSSGDYGTIGQVLSNPAGGGNLDWIDTAVFASKWTEFNQASRDTLVPTVSLGVSRVAIGPTNLIISPDTALSVSGGSISVSSSTLLMLAETPFLTNCDADVDSISSYSVCLGGTNTNANTGTGIYNSIIGIQAGEYIGDGERNSILGGYAGSFITSGSNNTITGFQALSSSGLTTAHQMVVSGADSLANTNYASTTVTSGYRTGYNATTTDSSVFIGHEAGYGAFPWGNVIAPASSLNTFVGYRSGYGAQSSMTGNTLLGANSGFTLAGSDYNTFLGSSAGYSMFSTNYNNVAIGRDAMRGTTAIGANDNVAIGWGSLYSIFSGDANVAVGVDALHENTTGFSNFALGEASLYSLISGSENTGIGTSALFSNITGNENVAIGSTALQRNQSATSSVAIGNEAGQGLGNYSNQNGVYVGYRAGEDVGTGSDNNTFIGYYAGANNTTGASSTILGFLSGDNITTGSHNLILGGNIDAPSATASNQLNIANIIFGTNIDGAGLDYSSGNIGIGTTTPYSRLAVAGQVVADYFTATSTTATSTFASGLKIGNPYGIKFEGYSPIPQLFATDQTTGVHFDGPGIMSIHNSGEQTMLLSSTQKVGIATSSPYARLSVVGETVSAYFTATTTTNSTFPSASTTALTVDGVASTTVLRIDRLADGCLNITSGLVGSQACGGGGGNSKWATSTIDANSVFNNMLGAVGIGTSTPRWQLQSASSTAPQLTLTDGLTAFHWSFRNAGGQLFFATSSNITFATSTASALKLDDNGDMTIHGLTISNLPTGRVPYTTTGGLLTSGTGLLFDGTKLTATYASTTALDVTGALNVNNASSSINNLRVVNDITSFSSTTALTVSGALMVNNASSSINNLRNVFGSSTVFNTTGTTNLSTTDGIVGVGTTSVDWANLMVNPIAGKALNQFVVGSSSATSLLINNSGNVLIGTSSIGYNTKFAVATSSTSVQPTISVMSTGPTTTIGFFVGTTTFQTAGSGRAGTPNQKNYIHIGNGQVPAGVSIHNGGLCISQSFCSASTTGRLSVTTAVQVGNADLAEMYHSKETLTAGDIVDITSPVNFVKKANGGAYGPTMGIVSSAPGFVLGLGTDDSIEGDKYAIALSGRVPVKINTENGQIKAGDYLTLSSQAGVAMKATQSGQVIARALEDGNGKDKILVFVDRSYQNLGQTTQTQTPQNITFIVIIGLLSGILGSFIIKLFN